MAHEAALQMINQSLYQVVAYGQQVADAFADSKIDVNEGITLGLQGVAIGQSLVAMFRRASPEMRAELAEVLKRAQVTLSLPA